MTVLLAALLGGCNRSVADEGQVVAIVGDEEITRAELQLEARERGLPVGTDRQVRDALVKELVERKLLVQHARENKLDRTPEFVLASRRLNEVALAQQLLSKVEGDVVAAGAIDKFIAKNPRAFAGRALYSVDYVQVPGPIGHDVQSRLLGAKTSAAIAQIVASAGLKGERKQELWDSASLTPTAYAVMKDVKPGQPFLLPAAGATLAGVLSFTSAQPVAEGQRAAVAQAMIQQEAKQMAVRDLVRQLEPRVRITYAPQFAPPNAKP
jgi:EpsD family peptidyl-prolyl cis-trans isomerase